MARYADFKADGSIVAFYSTDIHGERQLPVYGPTPAATEENPEPTPEVTGFIDNPSYPSGVVEITEDAWKEIMANPGTRRWKGGTLIEVPAPIETPAAVRVITRAQFFTQLALDGVITFEEAEATSSGAMPALLLGALDTIEDAAERFKARMLAMNAAMFDIGQPLVQVVAQALGWGPARLDKLWTAASKL